MGSFGRTKLTATHTRTQWLLLTPGPDYTEVCLCSPRPRVSQRYSSPITGLERPRVFQEVKVPSIS